MDKRIVEIIGPSGSGKTFLASDLINYMNENEKNIKTFYVPIRDRNKFSEFQNLIMKVVCEEDYIQEPNFNYIIDALKKCKRKILFILDFVEGNCNDIFAKEISKFVKEFPKCLINVVLFSQESILRELTSFDRLDVDICAPLHIQGFTYDEFYELAKICHKEVEENFLRRIYQKLTANRNSGLEASIAARLLCNSDEKMERLANLPAEEIIKKTDRDKFEKIDNIYPAAKRLVCFILPFTIKEAKEIFVDDYIYQPIQEMLNKGLLCYYDDNRLEMHEITRKALENILPNSKMKCNHEKLAQYYFNKGDMVTGLLHLEKAGLVNEAKEKAKKFFLKGEYWDQIYLYVLKHKLITKEEVLTTLQNYLSVVRGYVLNDIMLQLGDATTADNLFYILEMKQSSDDANELQNIAFIVEVILKINSKMVDRILELGIQNEKNNLFLLDWIIIGINRSYNIQIDTFKLLRFFYSANDQRKLKLINLMVNDSEGNYLGYIFEFINKIDENDSKFHLESCLKHINLSDKVIRLKSIIAIPAINKPEVILLNHGVVLENLEEFLWEKREILKEDCKVILKEDDSNELLIENSMRLLYLFCNKNLVELIEKYFDKNGRVGDIATYIASLLPQQINVEKYTRRLLDTREKIEIRKKLLFILNYTKNITDDIFNKLLENGNEKNIDWGDILLDYSIYAQDYSVLPILMIKLEKLKNKVMPQKYLILIRKFGELSGEEWIDNFCELLNHPSEEVRLMACLVLQNKRDKRALVPLINLCEKETNLAVTMEAVAAAVVSGPDDYRIFENVFIKWPETIVWRIELIGQLKYNREIEFLINTACDVNQFWKVRRMAIITASTFNSAVIMDKIAKNVFGENSGYSADKSYNLIGHNILSDYNKLFFSEYLRDNTDNKDETRKIIIELVEKANKSALFSDDAPSGEQAYQYILNKLESDYNNINKSNKYLDCYLKIENLIHIPLLQGEILRGYRLCGSFKKIEEILINTTSAWIYTRALCERIKDKNLNKSDIEYLNEIIKQSMFGKTCYSKNILSEIRNTSSSKTTNNKDNYKKIEIPYSYMDKVMILEKDYIIKEWVSRKNIISEELTYEKVNELLKGNYLELTHVFCLKNINTEQIQELIEKLNPKYDCFLVSKVNINPTIILKDNDYTIRSSYSTKTDELQECSIKLRAAIAAYGESTTSISWHSEYIKNNRYIGEKYVRNFIYALVLQNNKKLFYKEIEKYGDYYLDYLANSEISDAVKCFADENFLFYLEKWINTESDIHLQVMCNLVEMYKDNCIDNLLEQLFYKVCDKLKYSIINNKKCTKLFQCFNSLKKHSRFKMIHNYEYKVKELLYLPLYVFEKDDMIEMLGNRCNMYCLIIKYLYSSVQFGHYNKMQTEKFREYLDNLF